VTLLVRGSSLARSMSYYLIRQIEGIPNIKVRTCTEVTAADGTDHLERITLVNSADSTKETVDAQMLFLFIGAAPCTDWLDGVIKRDQYGFVITGPDLGSDRPAGWELDRLPYHLESSVPGIFAAGDARSESAKRVASAVGEGAMAVMLVHRYLEKA
jgi:thioredoxin reductase (NADPH)